MIIADNVPSSLSTGITVGVGSVGFSLSFVELSPSVEVSGALDSSPSSEFVVASGVGVSSSSTGVGVTSSSGVGVTSSGVGVISTVGSGSGDGDCKTSSGVGVGDSTGVGVISSLITVSSAGTETASWDNTVKSAINELIKKTAAAMPLKIFFKTSFFIIWDSKY